MKSKWKYAISGRKGEYGRDVYKRQVTDNLESRFVPGLYFAGEILDVDGLCGGYNLQWAWSSGYVAGKEAAGA